MLRYGGCETIFCALLQGYIYVEAHKESHVKEAIRGLTCLFYGKGGQLVPMKEMVDAITVKSTAKGSNIGVSCQHQQHVVFLTRPSVTLSMCACMLRKAPLFLMRTRVAVSGVLPILWNALPRCLYHASL